MLLPTISDEQGEEQINHSKKDKVKLDEHTLKRTRSASVNNLVIDFNTRRGLFYSPKIKVTK